MTYATTFSGIGGWELGLNACGWELKWQCEIDRFCQSWLSAEYGVPICPNIEGLYWWLKKQFGATKSARVDVLIGSTPCQPFSTAGRMLGEKDDRNLWPALFHVIKKLRPRYFCCENVTGIDGMVLDGMLSDLEFIGYETAPALEIPVAAIGAAHLRFRTYLVAYTERRGQPGPGQCVDEVYSAEDCHREASGIVDAFRKGTLPYLCRKHDGFSRAISQQAVKAFGNAVHPQIPYLIGQAINQIEAT